MGERDKGKDMRRCKIVRYLKPNWHRILIIVIVLLLFVVGMQLRIEKLSNRSLWFDENLQISKIKASLSATINASRSNVQFPGDYILIYPFHRFFGENKWGLAIPHIIITIIGFYLFYILCQKYFKTVWAYLIAFALYVYNCNLIFHAFEIRPYSVIVTLSMAAFLVMQYIFKELTPSLIKRVFISIFISVTILFHLFGAYILFFPYIYHLLFSKKEKPIGYIFLKHLRCYGLALVITLPILYWYLSLPSDIAIGTLSTFAFIPKGAIPILKGVFGNLIGQRRLYFLLAAIPLTFLIPHRERFKQIGFFMILIIIPIALLLLLCIHFEYWFIQRLFIWAIPLFAFLLGWMWESIIVYLAGKFRRHKENLSLS